MDKGRIDVASEHVEGSSKEATGKIIGDAGLTAEGKAKKAEGKIQNAVGAKSRTPSAA
jgi:uncharacterized protein YjbJ (UPF0337 family)